MTGPFLKEVFETGTDSDRSIVAEYGTIFARTKPHQKEQLIDLFIQSGDTVAMCGDGANDCNALKLAHCGISLSQLEASVAAHFTSYEANIECVDKLCREGRCAMVTSFGLFKYIAMYSMIQLISIPVPRKFTNC